MDNVITYIKFRGDLSLKQFPLNEIDAMIFTLISGFDFEGLFEGKTTISELNKKYVERNIHDTLDDELEQKEDILSMCANSVRFKDVIVSDYVKEISDEEEKTFYGMCFYISKKEAVVTFRGTDGSLLSWKENFVGIHTFPNAGHYTALKYLNAILKRRFLKVYVTGHSKGGNLALYSAIFADEKLKKKIKQVYVYDAPGFIDDLKENLGFLQIKDRIKAFIPVNSIIGRLMIPPCEPIIVNAFGPGLYQHDVFNWEVSFNSLERMVGTTEFSDDVSKQINDWINSIPMDERKRVVDEFFGVFSKNGINHINDMLHVDFKKVISLIKCLTSLSSENRELLGLIIKQIRNAKNS